MRQKPEKLSTFVYEGLGFPIRLINVPMRKSLGHWILDINFNRLHIGVLLLLVKKPERLSGKEIRFIRHYLEKSARDFGKLLGVSHVAVLKWENEERKMTIGTEIQIRLYILDHLRVTDKEFRKIYLTFTPEMIDRKDNIEYSLELDAERIAC